MRQTLTLDCSHTAHAWVLIPYAAPKYGDHAWTLDRVAPNLRVVATTDDGVIEAVEDRERRIYATQWHPELSMDLLAPEIEQNFFRNFLRRCEEYKAK